MMDLYIDETNLYNRMWLYTKQFDWEKMWAIADDITDEAAVRAKAEDILGTFDVEGDIKVAMAMSILKTVSGMGQLSEMYSIDFDEDLCIIGHSGSGDADFSRAKKPTMKLVPVFHGKTGGGYLTQFYPAPGPVTYLAITQDRDGHFKFVAAEGVNEDGPIFTFGDTNMRTRITCGARAFCDRWSEAGPTHHMAAASGRWIDTILKVAKIFNVPVDVITR